MPYIEDILEDYHEWLCAIVRTDLPEHRHYENLLWDLADKEFYWLLPMDENRDMDAFELRKEYYFDNGLNVNEVFDSPRSCLEVLIAFSKRIEIEVMGEPGDDHIEKWFWVMLENLEILIDDFHYNSEIVNKNLDNWLERKIKSNGKGGIFPLKKVANDQREVDMWYQMQYYMNENYPI